jgi:hypothetical protein
MQVAYLRAERRPLSLVKTWSTRTRTRQVAGNARGMTDEVEVSALS